MWLEYLMKYLIACGIGFNIMMLYLTVTLIFG